MAEVEAAARAPVFIVRHATSDDCSTFLALARAYADEMGKPFDEANARFVFGGLARHDPGILLLEADGEAVGFALVRSVRSPLIQAVTVKQELVYIKSDRRSVEAEMAVHDTTVLVFEATPQAAEIEMLVAAGLHPLEVIDRLRKIGLREADLRMVGTRASAYQDIANTLGSAGRSKAADEAAHATKH